MDTPTIHWHTDWDAAIAQARAEKKPILIDVYQDNCGGCERLDHETFGNPAVATEIAARFIPVKLHLRHDSAVVRDWSIIWTPTVVFADRSGKVRYQSINYMPAEDFLDILDIGEAIVAMRWRELDTAIRRLRNVEDRHPDGPMTAEAIYWRGMAAYFQQGNDSSVSRRVWSEISERFPDSVWVKRQP